MLFNRTIMILCWRYNETEPSRTKSFLFRKCWEDSKKGKYSQKKEQNPIINCFHNTACSLSGLEVCTESRIEQEERKGSRDGTYHVAPQIGQIRVWALFFSNQEWEEWSEGIREFHCLLFHCVGQWDRPNSLILVLQFWENESTLSENSFIIFILNSHPCNKNSSTALRLMSDLSWQPGECAWRKVSKVIEEMFIIIIIIAAPLQCRMVVFTKDKV